MRLSKVADIASASLDKASRKNSTAENSSPRSSVKGQGDDDVGLNSLLHCCKIALSSARKQRTKLARTHTGLRASLVILSNSPKATAARPALSFRSAISF